MQSVCLIVQNYYDIDPRVRRKAEALVAAGYEVDVISLKPSHNQMRKYQLNGVQIITLPVKKKRGSFFCYIYEYLMFFIMASFKVTALNLQKHYRAIDINTLPDFLVFAALIPKLLGAKVILDMHEVMPEFYMSKYKILNDHWIIRLIELQEKLSVKFADQVVTVNDPIGRLLQSRSLNGKKPTILMNSVDESLFSASIDEEVYTTDRSSKFIMMYHGTLTYIYGLDIALNAFSLVQNEMPQAEFWIVGDGPQKEALEDIVQTLNLKDKVKFIGMVPQQDIPNYLRLCDVGILPTRQDAFLDLSFSNKLSEYITLHKPVIASRLKTIRRYCSEQALAYFEPNNTSDLATKMLEIYHNPEARHELSVQAKLEYQPIRWNIMRRRYLNLVKNLIN